jgi:hypothetical protein
VAQLDPTTTQLSQARQVLLALLARELDGSQARDLAAAMARLRPTTKQLAQARQTLLDLHSGKTRTTESWEVWSLPQVIAELKPTVADLGDWHSWMVPSNPHYWLIYVRIPDFPSGSRCCHCSVDCLFSNDMEAPGDANNGYSARYP